MSSNVLCKNWTLCKPRMHPLISPASFTVTSSHCFYLFVCTWGKHSKQMVPKDSNFSQQRCTVENAVKAQLLYTGPGPRLLTHPTTLCASVSRSEECCNNHKAVGTIR